jgi:outer membrane protein assembly factor BamB
MFAIPVFAWAAALCMRLEGLTGIGNADIHARWNPTAEQQFLAERMSHNRPSTDKENGAGAGPIVAGPHDWTEFRGPHRDGAVHGVQVATNWSESPPKELWRRRVGPGWSSIIVVGGRVYSQEQRGDSEAVFCCDAATGEELWSHEDEARFSESMGGDGPRATPTFFDGKIYALGATGILNCLDAATGELKWTRDAAEGRRPKGAEPEHSQQPKKPDQSTSAEKSKAPETGMPLMYWGFASSPLVVDGNVIVFTGFDREDSLRAFRADSGEPAWRASAGAHSYSSPQLATFDGQRQVLMLSDAELTSTDPSNGRTLWRYESGVKAGDGFPAIQPRLVGEAGVVVSFKSDESAMRLEVSRKDDRWQVERASGSMQFKPYFSDCVQYEDVLYGFEAPVFCAVDVKSGKRLWKKGRYGAGQVLLLADQGVLVVISESGEAVLAAANPKKHQELGRFQAINGKTWNHPTIVDGRLYVRNAEEMACYELPPR